jgi:hypothetical protein
MCQHIATLTGWLTPRRGRAVRLFGSHSAYDRLLGLGVGG